MVKRGSGKRHSIRGKRRGMAMCIVALFMVLPGILHAQDDDIVISVSSTQISLPASESTIAIKAASSPIAPQQVTADISVSVRASPIDLPDREQTVSVTVRTTPITVPDAEGSIVVSVSAHPATLPTSEDTIIISASATPIELPATEATVTIVAAVFPGEPPPNEASVSIMASTTPIVIPDAEATFFIMVSTTPETLPPSERTISILASTIPIVPPPSSVDISILTSTTPIVLNDIDHLAILTSTNGTTGLTDVANFLAVPSFEAISLSWSEPYDIDYAGVRILRKAGSPPAGPDDEDAFVVFEGRGTAVVDPALTTLETFYYRAFSFTTGMVFSAGVGVTATPITREREALISLYNSAGGSTWLDRTNWRNSDDTNFNTTGTECTWFGVTCDLRNTHIRELDLPNNNMIGVLSPTIGNMIAIEKLNLSGNSIGGTIPPEIGDCLQLRELTMGYNHMTGPIPVELANLIHLVTLDINDNQLNGPLIEEITSLVSLTELKVASNNLVGALPQALENLVNLVEGLSDFRWNGLYTDEQTVRSFLDSKQIGHDWESTQTIGPTGLSAYSTSDDSVTLNWLPIPFTDESGGYEVYYSLDPGGPFILFDTTLDKQTVSMEVTGLAARTTYSFMIRTITSPHPNNQNLVRSDDSPTAGATTIFVAVPLFLTKIDNDIEIDWNFQAHVDYNILYKTSLFELFIPLYEQVSPPAMHLGAVTDPDDYYYAVEAIGDKTLPDHGNTPGPMRYVVGTGPHGFVQGPSCSPASTDQEGVSFIHVLRQDYTIMENMVSRTMWRDLASRQTSLPMDPSEYVADSDMGQPVNAVTWFEVVLFANLLSLEHGLQPCYYVDKEFRTILDRFNYKSGSCHCDFNASGYRLPTEGEWEFACSSRILKECHSTPQIEWCGDYFAPYPVRETDYTGPDTGIVRVLRTRCNPSQSRDCLCTSRDHEYPDIRNAAVGFRLVKKAGNQVTDYR